MKLGGVQTKDLQASFTAIANHIHTEVGTDSWSGEAAMWRVGVSHCIFVIPWLQDLGQSCDSSLGFVRTVLCILQGCCEDMGEYLLD